jgi:drug/metabolite transporter (DMT)-like permease
VDNQNRQLTLLTVAVLAVSTAAPAIRLGGGPALTVAFWRVALATLGVGLLSLWLTPGRLSFRQGLTPLAGVLLGLHFWVWIASLEWLTIARSVLLVSTQPAWAALLGLWFLRERVRLQGWIGIGLALVGAAVAAGGLQAPGRGDLYALAGAVLAAGYMVVGRRERSRLEIVPFLVRVYGWASLTLLVALTATRTALLPPRASDLWLYVFLAVVPTGIGHSLYNYALGHLPAYAVATAITAEPLGASLLAFALFGEIPEPTTWIAAPLVVAGIWLVVRRGRVSPPAEPI